MGISTARISLANSNVKKLADRFIMELLYSDVDTDIIEPIKSQPVL